MDGQTPRSTLYEQLARVGKALGSGKRLELIDLLAQGPRGVVELAAAAGLNVTTTSAHLQTLKSAGLVTTNRSGTTIRYSLADDDVAALYGEMVDFASAHLPDVEAAARAYLGPDDTEEIGRDELLRRVDAGEAILLDVRPATEYAAGHIPGAKSIPFDELADHLEELPEDLEVVAYCRGAYCTYSHDAVRLLNSKGQRAVRLADGIVEWRQTGEELARAGSKDQDDAASA